MSDGYVEPNELRKARAELFSEMAYRHFLHPESLEAYITDLYVHDHREIMKAPMGSKWLWLMRGTGTELAPLEDSTRAKSLEYWFKESEAEEVSERENVIRVYLLEVGGNPNIVHISVGEARGLIRGYVNAKN